MFSSRKNNFGKLDDIKPSGGTGKPKVAIIIVPAIGGSNVCLKQEKLKGWRSYIPELQPPKGFAGDKKTLMVWHHALKPMLTVRDMLLDAHLWEPLKLGTSGEKLRGWGQVVADYYKPFMDDCQQYEKLPFTPMVFAIGYNFTQSNEFSAITVQEQTAEIMTDPSLEGFIYVTHSMGTFPARYALKLMQASTKGKELYGKCIGVIHVAPPNFGAIETYARFLRGVQASNMLIGHILGSTGEKFTIPACVMPSIFELLPIPTERKKVFKINSQTTYFSQPKKGIAELSKASAELVEALKERVDLKDVDLDFKKHLPPQFASFADVIIATLVKKNRNEKNDLDLIGNSLISALTNLQRADNFHAKLGNFIHPNTATIVLTGLPTVQTITYIEPQTTSNSSIIFEFEINEKGDGTVTEESQSAYVNRTSIRKIQGVEHGEPLGQNGRKKVFPQIYGLMDLLWDDWKKRSPIATAQSFASSTVFPHAKGSFSDVLSSGPTLLNGMKVIFDQPVAVTPVTLEPKTQERRHGTRQTDRTYRSNGHKSNQNGHDRSSE